MSEEGNKVLALKNAWAGAVSASARVREMAPDVQALGDSVTVADLNLDDYHAASLGLSNAALALRGLVEELTRQRDRD